MMSTGTRVDVANFSQATTGFYEWNPLRRISNPIWDDVGTGCRK
jgi:hypothetical protein